MTPQELLMARREGGWTERVHSMPHHGSYSVAAHSHQMVVIVATVCPQPTKALLLACVFHDLPERWVGDTPWPAKNIINPKLGTELEITEAIFVDELGLSLELTDEEKLWLRFADAFEFHLWSWEQTMLGNRLMLPKCRNSWQALIKMELPKEAAAFLIDWKYSLSDDSKWLEDIYESMEGELNAEE